MLNNEPVSIETSATGAGYTYFPKASPGRNRPEGVLVRPVNRIYNIQGIKNEILLNRSRNCYTAYMLQR
jgi:hypothetical protein